MRKIYKLINRPNMTRRLTRLLLLVSVLSLPIGAWAEDYPITVAGVQVTDANAEEITGDNIYRTVTYDAENHILTLVDAEITGFIYSGLEALTIELTGTNTISGGIQFSSSNDVSDGNLIFTGTGSLEMTGQDGDCPVKYFENVTIGSGLYLQTNEPGTHWDGQRFSANGSGLSTLKITSDVYYPIWVIFDGVDYIQVSGENKDHVLGESNTAVTYDSDNDQLILNNFVCATTGGEYAICLGDQEEFKIHLLGENRISGGGVSFANEEASLVFSTDAQDPGTLTIVQPQDGYYPFTSIDESEVSYENGLGYTNNVVSTGWTRLTFGGTPITGTTQTVGDYTGVSFDASTNTLTLNNAVITTSEGVDAIVSSLENLTIFLAGDNNITCYGESTFNKTSAVDEATITFTTDATSNGSLTIMGQLFGEGVTPAYTNVSLKEDGDTKKINSSCGISVGGVDVTEFNKSDVFSDGKVSFTPAVPATDTTPAVPAILTLNGATIEPEEVTAGIAYENEDDLTIALIGNNSVRGGAGCMAIEKRYGTETPNLSFAKGDETQHFSLTLTADSENGWIDGFDADYGDFFVTEAEDDGTFTRTIASSVYGGTGSEDEPFLIKTPEDLKNFADDYNDGRFSRDAHIQLYDDIDCQEIEGFTPIADNSDATFCGVFDGNNKTISNLTISSDPSALFGFIGEYEDNNETISAMIQDLTLDNCTISEGKESGAIVANMYAGTVQNCTVNECEVTTRDAQGPSAGGIVGYINSGLIDGCKVQNSSISSTTEYEWGGGYTVAGGIAGRLLYDGDGITISDCEVSSSTITADDISPDGMGAGGIYGGYEAMEGTITISGNEVKEETQIITVDGYGEGDIDYSVYNGAIGSSYDEDIFTLSNNTYEYTVITSTKKGDAEAIVIDGYIQRGIGGTFNTETDKCEDGYDIIGGAEMYTRKLTLGKENIVEYGVDSYYELGSNYENGIFYLAPGAETIVTLQPDDYYAVTSATLSYGTTPTVEELENGGEEGMFEYTFSMPDADATLTATTEIPGYYGLTVAGIPVMEGNADNIFGEDFASASYDATSNTLTFKACMKSSEENPFIMIDGRSSLNIHFVGYNNLGYPESDYFIDSENNCTVDFSTDATMPGVMECIGRYLNTARVTIDSDTGLTMEEHNEDNYTSIHSTAVDGIAYFGYSELEDSEETGYAKQIQVSNTNNWYFSNAETIGDGVIIPRVTSSEQSPYVARMMTSGPGLVKSLTLQYDWGTNENTTVQVALMSLDGETTYATGTMENGKVTLTPSQQTPAIEEVCLTFTSESAFSFLPLAVKMTIQPTAPAIYAQTEESSTTVRFEHEMGLVHYTIDYVSDDLEDVDETEWDEEDTVPLAGPCTVKAFVVDNGEVSDTITGKFFGFIEPMQVLYSGTPVELTDLPALLPTTEGVTYEISQTSDGDVITYDEENGQWMVCGIGTVELTVSIPEEVQPLNDGCEATLTVNVVPRLDVAFVGSNLWASYYATENLAVPEGLTAYIVSGANATSGVVTVQQVDYIPADNGVLLQREANGAANGYVAAPYTGTTSTFINLLAGASATTDISSFEDQTVYVLFNDKFKRATSGTIPARRAFLPLAVAPAGAPQLMTLNVNDGISTGISTLAADDNGNDTWYTIDGLKLSGKPQHKGLYIKNGKKVFFNNK